MTTIKTRVRAWIVNAYRRGRCSNQRQVGWRIGYRQGSRQRREAGYSCGHEVRGYALGRYLVHYPV